MSNFQRYAEFYDLLYRDKDYAAEAEYVSRRIRSLSPDARTVLEFGSGTGRHGRLLAGLGFEVHGIERSPAMVKLANSGDGSMQDLGLGSFSCELGDICDADLVRTFDAVISLFHVMSYQTTNEALTAAFRVAANHLEPGGLFLFDIWHGPAVLTMKPEVRINEVDDARYRVKRVAHPELDTTRGTVKVDYRMGCEDKQTGHAFEFNDQHVMRYLMPTEVAFLATASGLEQILSEEFLTGMPPSSSTWGVLHVLQRL